MKRRNERRRKKITMKLKTKGTKVVVIKRKKLNVKIKKWIKMRRR